MIVFIRSVGERTTKKCQSMVKGSQIVSAMPFSKTIKKCFEIAIDSGEKHAICIDADCYPDENLCSELSKELDKNRNIFAVTCQMQDKLLNEVRTVGVHAYNVHHLKSALKYVEEGTYELRPEKYIRECMRSEGLQVVRRKGKLGMHGYDQYYKDIFRVSRMMFAKFPKTGSKNIERWESLKNKDPDYAVALEGWNSAIGSDTLFIDASIKLPIQETLNKLELKEKDELSAER